MGHSDEKGDRVGLVTEPVHLNQVIELCEETDSDPTSIALQYAAELSALWRASRCPREVKLAYLTAIYGEAGRLISQLAREDARVRAWQEAVPHMQTVYQNGKSIA